MPLILPGNVASATAAVGYSIDNSCRFNRADSAKFERAISGDGSLVAWTFNVWLKRGTITPSNHYSLLWNRDSSGTAAITSCEFYGAGAGLQTIYFYNYDNPGDGEKTLQTTARYRDPSAWYNLHLMWDSNNGTAGNRMRIFINGVEETDFILDQNPGSGAEGGLLRGSVATVLSIGYHPYNNSNYYDGYMANAIICDGQAYLPTKFGEFDEDSPTIWKPIDPAEQSLSFGTHGVWLDFADSSALGNDVSGQNNDFTPANLAAADQCVDSPTNNFATLNPLHMSDPSANYFVDNGNNTLEATNNDVDRLTGATIHPIGVKGYFEYKILTDNNCRVALQEDGVALTKSNYTALASGQFYGLYGDDITYANGGSSANHIVDYIDSSANGDIIGCAFDFTGSNRNVWWHLNGTYGNNGSGVGVPATGAYPGITSTQLSASKNFEFVFMCNTGSSSSSIALNFGNGSFDGTAISSAGTNASFGTFEYDVPSGFGPICTKTLNGTYS